MGSFPETLLDFTTDLTSLAKEVIKFPLERRALLDKI